MLLPGIQLTSVHRSLRRFFRTGYAIKLMNGLIVSLFLVHTVFCFAQSTASAREFVKQGTLLMSRNKIDAAIQSYTRAIELSPNYAEAYVGRGMARRAKGDLAAAIEDYEKAGAIQPKSIEGNRFVAQAYNNRGYIKLTALDVDDAIQDFTLAIKIDPNEPDHYYRRGLARLINEDLERALEDLNKALSISHPAPFSKGLIYATQGMVKLLQGRKVDAQKDFEMATKLTEAHKFFVEHHLRSLETQIMLMRQRRAKQQKSIV
jgi:tetratricopeptide (TPR) repeat protein